MVYTLKCVGIFGILLFGALFSLTFISTAVIEDSAKGFIQYQIEKELIENQQTLIDSSVTKNVIRLGESLGIESERIQKELQNNMPKKIAAIIAAMCGYECEKQKALEHSITLNYMDRLKNIQIAQATLGDLVKGKYIEIVSNVKLDLRIFLGANFAMFVVLLTISFAKPTAIVQLFVPCLLLVLATLVSSAIYIFGQDWFYTILYNDYMGFAYLFYLALIFCLLLDIVINKARITTEIVNSLAHAVGSTFSAFPC